MLGKMFITTTFAALLLSVTSLHAADQKVDEAMNKWVDAVNSHNEAAFVKLYHTKEFLLTADFDAPVITKVPDLSLYMNYVKKYNANFKVTQSWPQMFGDITVNTVLYSVTYTSVSDNLKHTGQCLATTVYKKEGGSLLIVNQHNSGIKDMLSSSSAATTASTTVVPVEANPGAVTPTPHVSTQSPSESLSPYGDINSAPNYQSTTP